MKRTLCLKLKHGICEKNPLHKVEAQYMRELGMPSTENDYVRTLDLLQENKI